ncbi:YheT family hydrolase [Desulfosoma caldarium]|nr:alpha/beta fold hydrolase [Desulfosoma caldarium]
MIVANQVRFVPGVVYRRERLETSDGDFLDLDWSRVGSSSVCILCHGLEGHSRRPYVLGMARALNRAGWDVCALNYRGCSGEPNRKPFFYHSGFTQDLDEVVKHVLERPCYDAVVLVGFSLGGNLILKYLGESARRVPPQLRAAAVFSVPCHLAASAKAISRPSNRIYLKRFLKRLRKKIEAKEDLFPETLNTRGYERIVTFEDFDNRYTAPLHGFRDAQDYYAKASSKPFLNSITVPTLIVNALDDPFLSPECFPYQEAYRNPYLFLETPRHGSHVGFYDFSPDGFIWSERRTVAFFRDQSLP